jgi:transposase, IS5 family
VEELLAKTIEAAVSMKAIAPKDLERVIADSTVQEKAIAFPSDSRLLDVARRKLVLIAKRVGVVRRQAFEKESRSLKRRAGGYAHARQYRRLRADLKRQRTIRGRFKRRLPLLTDGMKEIATM